MPRYCWWYVCRVVKCKFSDSPSCHCSACKSTKIITAYTYKWHSILISETIKYLFFHPWVLDIWEIFEIIMEFYCSENIYYIKVFMKYVVQHFTVSVLRRHSERTHYDLLHVQEDELLSPKTVAALILVLPSYLIRKIYLTLPLFHPFSIDSFWFWNSVHLLFIFPRLQPSSCELNTESWFNENLWSYTYQNLHNLVNWKDI